MVCGEDGDRGDGIGGLICTELVNDVFVAVNGARVTHPIAVPLALVGGGVDKEHAVDVVGDMGEGIAVDDLWIGGDDVVGVSVNVCAF